MPPAAPGVTPDVIKVGPSGVEAAGASMRGTDAGHSPRATWAALRRAVNARRRVLAAACAAAAAAAALDILAPPPPDLVAVLVASRDLPAGTALATGDLTARSVPRDVAPDGVLRPGAAVLGRTVTGAVRRGEPLTDVRLLGPAMLATASPGAVAVAIRLADPDSTSLVRPGDRVDVLAAPLDAEGASAVSVVAERALVLAVPAGTTAGDGAVVVVAVPSATARRLAGAAAAARLSIAVRGPE